MTVATIGKSYGVVPKATTSKKINSFSFGDPEKVLDRRELMDFEYEFWNGEYYETPVDQWSLAQTLHASTYHESAIDVKAHYPPHRWFRNQISADKANSDELPTA